jgi:hypothetical protein
LVPWPHLPTPHRAYSAPADSKMRIRGPSYRKERSLEIDFRSGKECS